MTDTLTSSAHRTVQPTPPPPDDPARRVDWRRLRSPAAAFALVCAAVAALGTTLGTVVAGLLAEDPSQGLVQLLALCVVGGAIIDTTGRVVWVGRADRVEGALREDLLDAAMKQPLAALNEQAVGEILDRVDDDTHEVGNLVRWQFWMLARTCFAVLPMWVVAGFTWWPAWLLFPLLAALTWFAIRSLLGEIARRKVLEEMAWTDQAAALEEGIAGRDDLRTSLGQPHVIARVARLTARVHSRFESVVGVERRLGFRAGVLLHSLLAGIGIAGVALAAGGDLSTARLVTLFLVTSTFIGQIAMLSNHLPDLQEGLGAVIRLRQMLAVEPEPVGGEAPATAGGLDIQIRDLDFSYAEGSFALRGVDLTVPAGETLALVGRTGSGKSTLASLFSRAVDVPRGAVFLGGTDVCDLDLQQLRAAVGVVTQRTEILAGTVAENITLFGDHPRSEVDAAVAELGLGSWVAGLTNGLDTLLGPGGTTLSAGEEQLVAFARLLVRDVSVVVLDEATARMDPLTERRVVVAADRLLTGRTGVLIAHRLSTIERAPLVAVLDHGRVVQRGRRAELAVAEGPFRELLTASRAEHRLEEETEDDVTDASPEHATLDHDTAAGSVGGHRRSGPAPELPEVGTGPSLAKGVLSALFVRPAWGIAGASLFLGASLTGAQGAVTGLVWGTIVEDLQGGRTPVLLVFALVLSLMAAPLMLAEAFWRYPRWWIEVMLRTRMSVLHGQTSQHRLPRTPPGEVVGRTMDADRYPRYADRWVDFVNGLVVAAVATLLAGTWVAGVVLLVVMVTSALASSIGRPVAGRSAAAASTARARFGRALVSALESIRTVKLASATPEVQQHLLDVDDGRVAAAVKEHRVQAFLGGVPMVMVQCGVVAAWAIYFGGGWGLATALLVANTVGGFEWFGRVAGMVVTEAPGTRAWQQETSRFAGGVDLMRLPPGVDLVTGAAPEPVSVPGVELEQLELSAFSAVHDDGTIGVLDVDLRVHAGELVLLLGQVGSGKSSMLAALAGLIEHRGTIRWNGSEVEDPQVFLRPGQVAHVAQVPRVLSGTFADNVLLGHDRRFEGPVDEARMSSDVADAGSTLR